MSLSNTLECRWKDYGDFQGNARIAQNLKAAMRASPNWEQLPSAMKESLEQIASKMGRLLNGDPYHKDGWHDIGGYALLIESRLE